MLLVNLSNPKNLFCSFQYLYGKSIENYSYIGIYCEPLYNHIPPTQIFLLCVVVYGLCLIDRSPNLMLTLLNLLGMFITLIMIMSHFFSTSGGKQSSKFTQQGNEKQFVKRFG